MPANRPPVDCREITLHDMPAAAALLKQGFRQPADHWTRVMQVLRDRDSPEPYPRFGYVLEREGELVGIVLTLFTHLPDGGGLKVRGNASSWYVTPKARGHGMRLVDKVLQHRDVTLLNVSPLPRTRRVIERWGFRRYTQGQFACVPALKRDAQSARIRAYRPADAARLADAGEARLMAEHAAFGCVSLVAETADGGLSPFVFSLRRIRRTPLRYAQIIYCHNTDQFSRFAGALGRWLLRCGAVVTTVDGDGPLPGLVGRYLHDRWPRYCVGEAPRPNELAYTEAVVLGL